MEYKLAPNGEDVIPVPTPIHSIEKMIDHYQVKERIDDKVQSDDIDDNTKEVITKHYGLQYWEKSLQLTKLPAVMCIQPKRNIGDIKWDHQITFPEELDMARFLESHSTATTTKYKLVGVVVHQGTFASGHYYWYLKDKQQQWLNFDDWSVRVTTKHAAIEEQFGTMGNELFDYFKLSREQVFGLKSGNQENKWKKRTWYNSAYLLTYVREDMVEEVLKDVEIPTSMLRWRSYKMNQWEIEEAE